ncbi:uncharacterized protein BYT42DRAFT_547693 [Radiomyces spectabilis]|uniref:uncharacterized protein n=1 Tax=Radiomyces spectabilis TaxID=64574 RepID=UPI00221FD618|nr:uncharacterized protein BYT42DRAFT_547693 [Radiomyces spectabilis]KAI8374698.1 hypothetical protein BYT42DRAFT_547693 [Radiomyces spectabilis]
MDDPLSRYALDDGDRLCDNSTSHATSPATEVDQPLRPEDTGWCKKVNKWHLKFSQVKITMAPHCEGYIFKKVVYVVETPQRGWRVLRRFSDVYWLWEILVCRYACRMIPNPPPKKIGKRDEAFLEARQRGLNRFINAVMRHPVLGKDPVVEAFLGYPWAFATWYKMHKPSLYEEFVRGEYDIGELERNIPRDLNDQLIRMKKRLSLAIRQYQTLCEAMENMIGTKEANAMDYIRYSITVNALNEAETNTPCCMHSCSSCIDIIKGCEAVSKSMHRTGLTLDEQATLLNDQILENLRRHYELFLGFASMLDRKNKLLQKTHIEGLAGRSSSPRSGVHAQHKVSDTDKFYTAGMTLQQQRQIYIQYCLTAELAYLHQEQRFITFVYRDFVELQLKFSAQLTGQWNALEACTKDISTKMTDL